MPRSAAIWNEIGILRLLRLPGVVEILDDGEHGGQPYAVMECLDGAPFLAPMPSTAQGTGFFS